MNGADDFPTRGIVADVPRLSRTPTQMNARHTLIGDFRRRVHDLWVHHAAPDTKAHHVWRAVEEELVRTLSGVITQRQSVSDVNAVAKGAPREIAWQA